MSIVVVTPNPAIDVTYRVDRQTIGTTQRVREVRRMPGGKGLNVARVLEDIGSPTVSVLPLGGAAGSWVQQRLDALGLAARIVPIADETRSTVTVVDDIDHPTMFGEPGPHVTPAEWQQLTDVISATAASAALVVISGSLPPAASPELVAGWVEKARLSGARTIVDVSGPALLAAAAAQASVVKPNRDELLDATGASSEAEGARALLARGAGAVVVSRGSAGICAYLPDGRLELAAVPGVTGNPTGAGDAATAGLALALSTDLGIDEALRQANALGAAAVLRPVAGEIHLAAYQRFLTELPLPAKENP
ncbi:1-phosphofructokinase family hexose kinase [Gryllotalpicola daejeonensis]|uniref:1-phosphofructokinase family hexose kinase n=1 Tax=Gryllotalpicola daejeonensis TaxID=993087 RepID=A0ABP7ZNT8_9MICO